jgi:hypothetical protein
MIGCRCGSRLDKRVPFAGPLHPATSTLNVHASYPRIRLTYDDVAALQR